MKHLHKENGLYQIYSKINQYVDPTVIKISDPEQIIYDLYDILDNPKFKNQEYLSICALYNGNLTIRINGSLASGEYIAYSINDQDWVTVTSTTYNIALNTGDTVRFKGNRTSYCPSGTNNTFYFNSWFIVYGNINSLTEDPVFGGPFGWQYNTRQFAYLFASNSYLLSIKNLKIPNAVGDSSIRNMFTTCSRLIDTFEGSLKLDGPSAAYYLFSGCNYLKNAKNLTIDLYGGNSACEGMFKSCSSLVNTPVINEHSDSTFSKIYYEMFSGCSSLVEVPEDYIPCLIKGTYAYYSMFKNCSSLSAIPKLKGSLNYNYICQLMFSGCTGLYSIDQHYFEYISDRTLDATSIFNSMFSGCTNLQQGPAYLPMVASVNLSIYQQMFNNCTSLIYLPAIYSMFTTFYWYNIFKNCNNHSYVLTSFAVKNKDGISFDSSTNITKLMLCDKGTDVLLSLPENKNVFIEALEDTTFSSNLQNYTVSNSVQFNPPSPSTEEPISFPTNPKDLWQYCKNTQNCWLYNPTDDTFGYISNLRTTTEYNVYDITIGDVTLRVAQTKSNLNNYLWYIEGSNASSTNDDEGFVELWNSKGIYSFDKYDYADCFIQLN